MGTFFFFFFFFLRGGVVDMEVYLDVCFFLLFSVFFGFELVFYSVV